MIRLQMRRGSIQFSLVLFSFCLSAQVGQPPSASVQGVTDTEILFGQSAALTDTAKNLGISMRAGILAAFEEVNRKGGVHGRKLRLITRDDKYEPERAIANVRQLIDQDKVFAFVGGVGTPTSKAVVPITAQASLPYIGPFTGASFLRSAPHLDSVINVRASYFQETKKMIDLLKNDLGVNRLAVLYQNDSYGLDGLKGVRLAIKDQKNMKITALGAYTRNTTAVKTALLDIQKGKPKAIIIIGSYLPTAHFIKWAEKIGLSRSAIFMAVSFVGVSPLSRELKNSKSHVYVTQVVPFPYDLEKPIIRNYQKALKDNGDLNKLGLVSLEGYIVGRLVSMVLEKTGPKPDYKSFLDTLKATKTQFNIDDMTLTYGPTDNQGANSIFLTKITKGKVISVQNLKSSLALVRNP